MTGKIIVASLSGLTVANSLYWLFRETYGMAREWVSKDNLFLLVLWVYVGNM